MYESREPSPEKGQGLVRVEDLTLILFKVLDVVIFVVIVFAPAIPYLKQYSIIKSTKEVGAFSIYVCAIVLYGQVFRILFW